MKVKNKITMHVYARESAVSRSEREDWQLIAARDCKKDKQRKKLINNLRCVWYGVSYQ